MDTQHAWRHNVTPNLKKNVIVLGSHFCFKKTVIVRIEKFHRESRNFIENREISSIIVISPEILITESRNSWDLHTLLSVDDLDFPSKFFGQNRESFMRIEKFSRESRNFHENQNFFRDTHQRIEKLLRLANLIVCREAWFSIKSHRTIIFFNS